MSGSASRPRASRVGTSRAGAEASSAEGYLHPRYAASHREHGKPRELAGCGGWIVERRVPGSADRDAMGCYPLFACRDWSRLHRDVEGLEGGLVSLALVTDPFGSYDEATLRRCFPDLAVPWKEHHVIDLERPPEQVVTHGHRRTSRRALRSLEVDAPAPAGFLDEWMSLHRHLVARHRVEGIAAFSRAAFAEQLATPGMVVLRASFAGEPVAAILFLTHADVAYGHVLACTPHGYRRNAIYALIWSAIEHFSGSHRWIDLMGVPGARDEGSEGIRRFKLGWSRETRTAWLCGRVLDRRRYDALVAARETAAAGYFPAYRAGELA